MRKNEDEICSYNHGKKKKKYKLLENLHSVTKKENHNYFFKNIPTSYFHCMFILKTNIRDQVPFIRVSFYTDFEETSFCFFDKQKAFTGKETEQVK